MFHAAIIGVAFLNFSKKIRSFCSPSAAVTSRSPAPSPPSFLAGSTWPRAAWVTAVDHVDNVDHGPTVARLACRVAARQSRGQCGQWPVKRKACVAWTWARGFVDNVDMWTIDFKSVNPLWGAG